MKNRKTRSHAPLAFERLESRLPLAGDVALKFSGGSLKVTGDDAANEISIVQDANVIGTFRVNALDVETLTLNGQAYVSGTAIPDILKDITVDLKKGNDFVRLTGDDIAVADNVTARNITIKTGAGGDEVEVNEVKATGKVTVDTGAGDVNADGDVVTFQDVVIANTLSVKTGKGDDDVELFGVDVTANATVKTGDGADGVTVDAFFGASKYGKNLSINSGTGIKASGGQVLGGDFVGVFNTAVTGNVSIITLGGADIVQIENSTAKKGSVSTGKGNDDVVVATAIDAEVKLEQALINLGAGDDDLAIGTLDVGVPLAKLNLTGPAKTKVNGGAGTNDRLFTNGDILGAGLATAVLSGFEVDDLP